MLRKLLLGTIVSALLGACAMAGPVKVPKKQCVTYTDSYKQSELDGIEEMLQGEDKLNVLFLVADDGDWQEVKDNADKIVPAILDSPLKKYNSDPYLEPLLGDDNITVKPVSDAEDFYNAIAEEEDGSIDVFYFLGHGLSWSIDVGGEKILRYEVKKMGKKGVLEDKFSEKAVGIMLSCETLKGHDYKTTITEKLSDALQIPMIGSEKISFLAVVSVTIGDAEPEYLPSSQIGEWDIVFPYSCD